ncbi:BamA/TamA family outer membrane protein [Dysgonomonas sp. Marseille-P4677]|uniref:BamA/OMP85 family outer membrane protein n=1 Tax=Dysgonomonas sp. Marseille-P4677 TaxID=2364790 RepID=UPI0019121D95|nr:POTRA domain-containing protein [Dysgonomonas sp. Marseille-P4677]MBK5720595.1 BamA/TamA family outer membrane protein [Dysgonomonas sp. Marseille-P4677]
MFKKGLSILFIILCSVSAGVKAQITDSTEIKNVNKALQENVDNLPVISYDNSRTYEIADLKLSGIVNPMYEDFTLFGFAELQVGDKIEIPGAEITNAVKRFWRQGLFSDVKILATKIEGNKIWIEINLKERPRISDIVYTGMKKSERQDIDAKIGMEKNLQITPNKMDRAKMIIKKYFDEKGFNKAEITLTEKPDLSKENHVILHIDVVKKNKTKVNKITMEGNINVKASKLEKAMKKTRHKSNFKSWLANFLRSTKFVPENYEEDKENLIAKYNELGYRDAVIVFDTVYADAKKTDKVNIDIKIEEGQQYFLKDIKWVGNTVYPTWQLQQLLNMKPGDVYNQKKLTERLSNDEDGVMNYFYQNHGYIFSNADPVEVNIDSDSIDLEIRISEGPKASIRKVTIAGNDRVYEDVVRRELRIKPGALYSRDDIVRSLREIAQTGHFDPENLQPGIVPDPDSGTVDVSLPLVSKANDQVEFSAGWGQTGIIGKLSLKFSNFSLKNLLNPKSYKGIIPQGEGQTLTLSAQTNAKFYQSYSISFMDPWFGGKRPNSLSVGAYYSKQTDINSRYINNNYGGYGYGGYGYGGYGYGGYGNGYGYGNSYGDYSFASDPNKSIQMIGASVGYGKRLSWPDDYFYAQAELSYQLYSMRDWDYFIVRNGNSNNLSLNLSLSRRSIDNPVYTRRGTDISLSLQITPPYSVFDGKDYASMQRDEYGYESGEKFKWIEYHKWKFKAKTFTSLYDTQKTPVLMTRAEYGFVGYFNKDKKSPFETFYVGGDGMSGYSSTYATETIGLRGYENGSLGSQASAYSRLALELRYPLILEPSSTIYLLTFVEAGNAWNDLKKFNPFDLKRSAGVGARIMLPMIGLMGIDWAYGFDSPNTSSSGKSGSQFHFIIGQEF